MNAPVLEASGLRKSFGALVVADNVTLNLMPGARHALIGPNGAGKTTLVGLLSGSVALDGGKIRLLGHDITGDRPERRVKRGLVRTFQINNLFTEFTVLENVFLAASEYQSATRNMLRPAGLRRDVIERAQRALTQLGIENEAHHRVCNISYGLQRLVEIAIALCLQPRVLLLDEPTAGVPTNEVSRLIDVIERLPQEMAILMIEHDMQMVRRFAREVTVMVNGAILISGPPQEVMMHDDVRTAYLGQYGQSRFAARPGNA